MKSANVNIPPAPSNGPDEYTAASGHLMVTREWRNNLRVQWNADHSDNCPCHTSEDW